MTFKKRLTFRRLINYFLAGLLISLPIWGTAYVIKTAFTFVDGIIDTQYFFGFTIPGLGVLIVLSLITFVGFIGQGLISKQLIDFFDHALEKTPGVKVIYSMIKDFIEAFVGDKKKFTEGVAVEMTNGIYKLGFVTNKNLSSIQMEGLVAVYFPHSYNFSGNLFLVPQERIKPLKGNSSELMKFIVSGGVTDVEAITKTAKHETITD